MNERGAGRLWIKPIVFLAAIVLAALLSLAGCGSSGTSSSGSSDSDSSTSEVASTASDTSDEEATEETDLPETDSSLQTDDEPIDIEGLTYESKMDLQYATQFDVYYYNDGYKVIASHGDGRYYLLVPEGAETPSNLDDDVIVLQQPLDHIYLAATAAMSLFCAIDGQSAVTLTGTNTSGWKIQEPIDLLNSGDLIYAGSYSQPDYELLVEQECDLAIESTMILHNPDVQEMLEDMGIPVFIERSSYESQPLGRTEWVKAYGAMLDLEDEASTFFDEQVASIADLGSYENTGKTVAFFSVSSTGAVVIRKPSDYIAQSIAIAGGVYAFADVEEQGSGTTMSITMEDFYDGAKDADYLVYNGTIEDPITSVDDLLAKSDTFADYKAVQDGNVWVTDKSMYQATDKIADMIIDFHTLVTSEDESQMTFLSRVQ